MILLIYHGYDNLQEKGLNGCHIYQLQVDQRYTTQKLLKEGSPSPETTARARCICRWTAWRLKTLLCITVHGGHSDWMQWPGCTKTLQLHIIQGNLIYFSSHLLPHWTITQNSILQSQLSRPYFSDYLIV